MSTIIKDGTGNIETSDGEDITLDETEKVVLLQYDLALAKWLVVSTPVSVANFVASTVVTNSTRATIANGNTGTIWTQSYTKQRSDTDLIIMGTIYAYGNGTSGRVCATAKYGAGTTIQGGVALTQTSSSDWVRGHAIGCHFTGHTTTGAQDIVLGWDFGDASSSRPFATFNPNSTDIASSLTMVSLMQIFEVIP